MATQRWTRSCAAAVAALCFTLILASCGREKQKLAPDPNFSINVMEVPEFWPREDKDWPKDEEKRLAMEGTYAEMGRPDSFRVIWTPDRRIMRQREMVEMLDQKGRGLNKTPELEWIYIDKGKIVRFTPKEAQARDLDDRTLTLCRLGDPNDVKVRRDPDGRNVEIYTYYNTGQIIYFDQKSGKQLKEDQVAPTPGFIKRY